MRSIKTFIIEEESDEENIDCINCVRGIAGTWWSDSWILLSNCGKYSGNNWMDFNLLLFYIEVSIWQEEQKVACKGISLMLG